MTLQLFFDCDYNPGYAHPRPMSIQTVLMHCKAYTDNPSGTNSRHGHTTHDGLASTRASCAKQYAFDFISGFVVFWQFNQPTQEEWTLLRCVEAHARRRVEWSQSAREDARDGGRELDCVMEHGTPWRVSLLHDAMQVARKYPPSVRRQHFKLLLRFWKKSEAS